MKPISVVILLALLLLSCSRYRLIKQADGYILVEHFDEFLRIKHGVVRSNERSLFGPEKDDLIIFFDSGDSILYVNQTYGKDNLADILYEVWDRRSYLTVVCDPRATSQERETYYLLYNTFFKAGQKLLNDRAIATYGRSVAEIDISSRRKLGLAGVPFILDTGNIIDPEYLRWVDDFPLSIVRWNGGIYMDLVPDH